MNEELKMPELPAPGCTYADSRYPAFGRKQVERIQREAFEAGVAASDERFWVALVPQSATPSQPVAAEATAEVDPWNDAAALAEMAYLLRLVPRADVVPVQILDVMKRQMAAALKAARLAAPVNVQAGAHAEVTPNGTETNRRAAPDAALSAIHAGVSAMRGQQHKMEGTGQTHTYVVKDDVLGWIENEQRKLAAPVEVQGQWGLVDAVLRDTCTSEGYRLSRIRKLCDVALAGRPAPAPEAWEPGGIDVTGMTTSAIRPMSCATRPAAPLSEVDWLAKRELTEPVNIAKAMLAHEKAHVVLDKGTGPKCFVGLVNIQLTGWSTHDVPQANAFAEGFNTGARVMRESLAALRPTPSNERG